MSTGASFARGASKQDYKTPAPFMSAVHARFGHPSYDLAAHAENTQVPYYYFTEEQNSLVQNWHAIRGLLWLNPPFSDITPWAKKCAEESAKGAQILFLVPASVGSEWYHNYVHRKALVLGLRERLSFDGKNPYPKDLILACYGKTPDFDTWRWRDSIPHEIA